MIAKAREYDKAVNTFIEGLLGYVHEGRIHADINQIRSDSGGTVTGRFSMSNPNLQQIPSKGFIGTKMRELFIPEDGCKWGSFDYSQQEPRIVVHYAIKLGLPGTENLQEEFDKDDADFHQIVADMANISRKQAKTINLGLFYGMGKIKLQKELGLDQRQARELFNEYHGRVPFVRQLSQELITFAKDNSMQFITQAGVPVTYNKPAGKTYFLIQETPTLMDWPDAKTLTDSFEGASMYIIIDELMETAVFQGLQSMDRLDGPFWMGLFQDRNADDYDEPDKGWYWVNGNKLGDGYTNWHAGEPNDAGNEDYGQFNFSDFGIEWNDMAVGNGQSYAMFEFTAEDSAADINITVSEFNDPPVATPQNVSTDEDLSLIHI